MRVFIRTPYSLEKNLGKAYNEEMALLPDDSAACFIDGDVCFLTPDYGHIINQYANQNPNAVLTCWTNRIHELAKGQRLNEAFNDIRDDFQKCMVAAEALKQGSRVPFGTSPIKDSVSGFLLVVPKSVWNKHKFSEINTFNPGIPNLLGCDNEWTNRIRREGVEILRMDGLLVWHSYRLLTGTKHHLL